MPDSPDKPFGVAGQAFGLRVQEPPFEEGDEVRWATRANRFQNGIRAIGGRIYLTDRQLVFAPNKFEKKVAGRAWSAQFADSRYGHLMPGTRNQARELVDAYMDAAAA